MKCPKCDYISFGDQPRCSNCGYDASLGPAPAPPVDLDLRVEPGVEGPPGELTLTPAAAPARAPASRDARPSLQASDLPLFDRAVPGVDDTPMLSAPSAPRPPLAVRRGAPDGPRAASAAVRAAEPATRVSRPAPTAAESTDVPSSAHSDDENAAAPAGSRLFAAAIDTAILLGIDFAVVYFTLRVTGLETSQIGRLPAVPLIGFLLLVDLGYLVGFTTASGQTIGKMLTGVQVIGGTTSRVPLGQAIIRAASVGLTWLSLGVGYLPALLSGDRRALHDRLAGTRVVRR